MPEMVPMPKLGFDMAEGTLVRKVKKEGESVNKGEVLAEIETDKATVEVEAPASGVVKAWVVEEGQPVPVGALMAVLGAPDEQVDVESLRRQASGEESGAMTKAAAADVPQGGAMGKAAPTAEAQPTRPGEGARPPAPAAEPTNGAPARPPAQARPDGQPPAAVAPPAGGSAPASPIARKMAAEAGIDIQRVRGTGPGGRITKKDVEAYLAQPAEARAQPAQAAQPAAQPAAPEPMPAISVSREDQEVPLTRLRQIIARRMVESKQNFPQFYVTADIDMAPAMELRKSLNALVPEDRRISVNDFVVKAAALALREFPNLNATFAGDKIVRRGHVNVGNAVAVENGLLTVVVKDADVKTLAQIAVEIKAMAGRARSGKVQPGDIEGSTFSISNLGMYDVDRFIAIINPPEAGILAVGTVRQVPVVRDGAIVVGQRMQATVSADHRVTDGAEAARFLQAIKQKLENPYHLVL